MKRTLLFTLVMLFSTNAFAIVDVKECEQEVKAVINDLLKANITAEELIAADPLLHNATESCISLSFTTAEDAIAKVREMIGKVAATVDGN